MKRILILFLLLIFLIGCTSNTQTSNIQNNQEETIQSMKLTSPSFYNNEKIPEKYTCNGQNISPELNITNIPTNTKSLVLIMDDPDAVQVVGKVWVHWLIFNIPPITNIEEATEPNGIFGTIDSDKLGYAGPCPPSEHSYIFKIYALDTELNLQQGATKEQIENAMNSHILSQAQLIGNYG